MGASKSGVVIDVQIFTRDRVEKDSRAMMIDEERLENIKKDIQNDNPFSSIEKINGWQSKVKNIHIYLTNKEIDDIDEMKQDIIDLLFIPGHETIFINDLIYNDDTNEKVLMKISEYCYNINEPTPSKYIFSYYTTNENTILSLNIDYILGNHTYNQTEFV